MACTSSLTVTIGINHAPGEMATLPEYQHQGIGQAVFGQIIKLYRERRTADFHLVANSIGRPYEKVGFVSIDNLTRWVR